MNWDTIEVKWSEMARRASGFGSRTDTGNRPDTAGAPAISDAGPVGPLVRDVAGTLDRANA